MSGSLESTRKNLPTQTYLLLANQNTHRTEQGTGPTFENGELAQLGERLVCNQEVTGSSPVFSTVFRGPMLGIGRSLTTEYSANGSFFRPHIHPPERASAKVDTQCA